MPSFLLSPYFSFLFILDAFWALSTSSSESEGPTPASERRVSRKTSHDEGKKQKCGADNGEKHLPSTPAFAFVANAADSACMNPFILIGTYSKYLWFHSP
jgi:hypothetical protein